jgi:hypothetical protein
MDLLSIAKAVGTGVVSTMVPGGPAIVAAVNAFLPKESALPATATGTDIINVASSLPVADREKFYDMQFDVQLETIKQEGETARTMLMTEATTPHTTRPYIAKGSFQLIAVCTFLIVAGWLIAVIMKDKNMVAAITAGWPWVVGLLAPFVTLLYRYFGVLKTEQAQKLDAANNSPANGLASAVGGIIKALKKQG